MPLILAVCHHERKLLRSHSVQQACPEHFSILSRAEGRSTAPHPTTRQIVPYLFHPALPSTREQVHEQLSLTVPSPPSLHILGWSDSNATYQDI